MIGVSRTIDQYRSQQKGDHAVLGEAPFIDDHLQAFREAIRDLEFVDKRERLWHDWAAANGLGEFWPSDGQNRRHLFALAEDKFVPAKACCWSILAWGGMHGNHRDLLFRQDHSWIELAERIRAGEYDRRAAYDQFAKLRRESRLVGMGPAYFTKLIFFLMPRTGSRPPGYIMDQWVACSINLLLGRDLVKMNATYTWKDDRKGRRMDSDFYVSDVNDGDKYEACCVSIERLASEIGRSPDVTEWLLMSEGAGKGEWRKYVKSNRRPPSGPDNLA